MACLEKAQQQFPMLGQYFDAEDAKAKNEDFVSEADLGEFRMVSTGKFIWTLSIPAPAQGKLICTGDFNKRNIETLNYNGLDKRPAVNELWTIESMTVWPTEADAIATDNMED